MDEKIRVYSVDYKDRAHYLGEDTVANFEAVRDLTYAAPSSMDKEKFGILGHDESHFLAYIVS